MCMPKTPPAPEPAPMPVNTSQVVEDQTAPELVKANEQDLKIKKKKVKKSGTSSLNTSSGLNIATNSSL
ncbi:N-acetyltransferase [Pelagibacter phage Jormungand EXVC012P]|nr:N-acetyltransferase [Pelagibacter phage Jormungand EXVC012P]QLF88522.1 N-acetyltransferase [Pelagibacter phage Ran EXVC014P]